MLRCFTTQEEAEKLVSEWMKIGTGFTLHYRYDQGLIIRRISKNFDTVNWCYARPRCSSRIFIASFSDMTLDKALAIKKRFVPEPFFYRSRIVKRKEIPVQTDCDPTENIPPKETESSESLLKIISSKVVEMIEARVREIVSDQIRRELGA